MEKFYVEPIGEISIRDEGMFIELDKKYIPALQGLDDFSHVNVIWWFSDCDFQEARDIVEVDQPYKKAPAKMGIFATRAPVRPNPVALTTVQMIGIDHEKGIIQIGYIDANDGTPVIDLKPYTPSFDRIETPGVPQWCSHWPMSMEASGAFNWENEFNF